MIKVFYLYMYDLIFRIILVFLFIGVIYYNIDIIISMFVFTFINNYLSNSLSTFDYSIDLENSRSSYNCVISYEYVIPNSVINISIQTMNADIFSVFYTLMISLPYVGYHIMMYLYSINYNYQKNKLKYYFISCTLLYLSFIIFYNIYIFPTIFHLDWDNVFDSDISGILPYGIEFLFSINYMQIVKIYITYLFLSSIILTLIIYSIKLNKIIFKFWFYLICILLFDTSSLYIIIIGEFYNLINKIIKNYDYLSTSPKTIS